MEGRDAGFGGGVVGEARGACGAEDGGEGHDGAVAGGEHAGEEGLEGVEVGEEVDAEVAVDFFD